MLGGWGTCFIKATHVLISSIQFYNYSLSAMGERFNFPLLRLVFTYFPLLRFTSHFFIELYTNLMRIEITNYVEQKTFD